MRILGKTMHDHLANVAKTLPDGRVTMVNDMECLANIKTTQAFVEYRGDMDKEAPNRPYLHFMGECNVLRGNFPEGPTEIHFEDGKGIDVNLYYEFDNSELIDLISKGWLYNPDAKCPDIFYGTTLEEIPVVCEGRKVEPQVEGGTPIYFLDIKDASVLETDGAHSGYRMGDYFDTPQHDTFEEMDVDIPELSGWDSLSMDIFEHADKQVEQEMGRELTEEEKTFMERVNNIHKRVIRDHVRVDRKHLARRLPEFDADGKLVDEPQEHAGDELYDKFMSMLESEVGAEPSTETAEVTPDVVLFSHVEDAPEPEHDAVFDFDISEDVEPEPAAEEPVAEEPAVEGSEEDVEETFDEMDFEDIDDLEPEMYDIQAHTQAVLDVADSLSDFNKVSREHEDASYD